MTVKKTDQIKSIAKIVSTSVATRVVRADPEKAKARWAICDVCPHLIDDKCEFCGCRMRNKVNWEHATCELKKWGEEKGE